MEDTFQTFDTQIPEGEGEVTATRGWMQAKAAPPPRAAMDASFQGGEGKNSIPRPAATHFTPYDNEKSWTVNETRNEATTTRRLYHVFTTDCDAKQMSVPKRITHFFSSLTKGLLGTSEVDARETNGALASETLHRTKEAADGEARATVGGAEAKERALLHEAGKRKEEYLQTRGSLAEPTEGLRKQSVLPAFLQREVAPFLTGGKTSKQAYEGMSRDAWRGVVRHAEANGEGRAAAGDVIAGGQEVEGREGAFQAMAERASSLTVVHLSQRTRQESLLENLKPNKDPTTEKAARQSASTIGARMRGPEMSAGGTGRERIFNERSTPLSAPSYIRQELVVAPLSWADTGPEAHMSSVSAVLEGNATDHRPQAMLGGREGETQTRAESGAVRMASGDAMRGASDSKLKRMEGANATVASAQGKSDRSRRGKEAIAQPVPCKGGENMVQACAPPSVKDRLSQVTEVRPLSMAGSTPHPLSVRQNEALYVMDGRR